MLKAHRITQDALELERVTVASEHAASGKVASGISSPRSSEQSACSNLTSNHIPSSDDQLYLLCDGRKQPSVVCTFNPTRYLTLSGLTSPTAFLQVRTRLSLPFYRGGSPINPTADAMIRFPPSQNADWGVLDTCC